MLSSVVFKHENRSQSKVFKEANSKGPNIFLINTKVSFTLYINFLTSRDSNKNFELKEDISEFTTNYIFDVGTVEDTRDRKLMYGSGKEMNFDNIHRGNNRRIYLFLSCLNRRLRWIYGIASRSKGSTRKKWLSSDSNELCDELELLMQEKNSRK